MPNADYNRQCKQHAHESDLPTKWNNTTLHIQVELGYYGAGFLYVSYCQRILDTIA